MDAKHIIEDHQYQNIPLNYDEAYELGQYAVDTYCQVPVQLTP